MIDELGIYCKDDSLFSKNIDSDVVVTSPDSSTLEADILHNISAKLDDAFTVPLETGMVISMQLKYPSDDFMLEIEHEDGSLYLRTLYRSGSHWISTNRSILKTGTYKFRFIPQNNDTVTLQFGFTNNNRKTLTDISSGDNISVSLTGWGYEYAKYRLSLNVGDLLTVSAPSDNDILMSLVNSNSQILANAGAGGEIYTKVYSSGTYYLFIKNEDHDNSSSYSGSIVVTPDQNISKYPVLSINTKRQKLEILQKRSDSNIVDQTAIKNVFFTLQLLASNTPTKFDATGLPTGLTIDELTGLISGTPTISGIFPIKVSVENEFGKDENNFLLTVKNNLVWDADNNEKWSLPDIIYGLQVLTGFQNESK
jgi:hypothetical protein